ncbi:19742_t:CDS:2 [Dentiscutata erythropus]|uniref:19742_t:CDS:1 n=1 Tax=Dentiscutata erythropus TaxID=1348616 RepID=A0A9N8ZI44_9GLOM|nr:19742_t:CDS:2 [Dentiscutata erythropus]
MYEHKLGHCYEFGNFANEKKNFSLKKLAFERYMKSVEGVGTANDRVKAFRWWWYVKPTNDDKLRKLNRCQYEFVNAE